MAEIRVRLPDELDIKVGMHKVKNKLGSKESAIIDIVKKYKD
jgi:hypothetical protein